MAEATFRPRPHRLATALFWDESVTTDEAVEFVRRFSPLREVHVHEATVNGERTSTILRVYPSRFPPARGFAVCRGQWLVYDNAEGLLAMSDSEFRLRWEPSE